MTRHYSENFKARMVQRLAGPDAISAKALSAEVGIGQPTLSRWLREAASIRAVTDERDSHQKPLRPDDWSPAEKLAAVLAAEAIADSALGNWLRAKGLTEQHLREWRETLAASAIDVFGPRPTRPDPEDRKRVRELEKELNRKEKALAEAAALLVLQGKVRALWAGEDSATRQSSDDSSSKLSPRRKPLGRR